MPIVDLDSDQRKAAVSKSAQVAVSAGAGSGKTRLLVGRYLHFLMKDKLPLHAIAAITFTNKAADQMKARVAERARGLAGENGEYASFWRKVADGVHHAPISTIHSFCGSILRSHPVEAGIDPSYTVLDEVTNAEIRNAAVDSYVNKRLMEIPDDMAFLLDVFGISDLKQIYHSLLRSRSHVVKFLDKLEHVGGVSEISFANVYRASQAEKVQTYLGNLECFRVFCPEDDGFVPEYDRLVSLLRDAVSMLETNTVDPERIGFEAGTLNFRKGSASKWGAEQLKLLKAGMKECRTLLEMIAGYERNEKHITPRAAALVLREFSLLDEMYLTRKKSLSGYDNDDILIETWRLLRTNVRLCREISLSFKHILVDEFQDTDGIQMDILDMIAGNSSAVLFAVGDPKQSIYRFRGADVAVFNAFVKQKETGFHRLTTNYRSKPSVMAFVNTAFGRIIGEEARFSFEAIYTHMKPYRKNDDDNPAVDVFVIDDCDVATRRAREAELIADRISAFHDTGINGKRYRYGEMAILLRKSTSIDFYEEALMRAGIPFVNRIGGRLSGNPVTYDIGNLLGWLNDPDNPALLTAVLLSPFIGFDADDVFILRTRAGSAGQMSSWLRGEHAHSDPVFGPAATVLSSLVRRINRVSIRELLEYAFDITGYTSRLLTDPVRGEQSLAVTGLILDTADTFEENGGTSVEFSGLLRSGSEFTSESAHVETEGDAVPILTIHGAKGLEFPVVFLADIPAGVKGGRSDAVIFDDDIGPGFTIRDDRGVSAGTYATWYAGQGNRLRDIAENKRLFYVGCTRAEDYLVILGGRPKKTDTSFEKNNWMAWLYASLDIPVDDSVENISSDKYRLFRVAPDTDIHHTSVSDFWQTLLDESAIPADESVHLRNELIGDIPPVPRDGLPALLSPTRLITYRACPARYYYRYVHGLDLSFSGGESSSMGTAYGDFAHKVLEKINFADPRSWQETAHNNFDPSMPAHMLTSLLNDLEQFAETTLYRDSILPADEIRREEPFMMLAGDVLFRGNIDLYCRNNDQITIVDYKTTSSIPESPDDIPDNYRFQLGLYGLAVHKAQHVVPSTLIIQYLGAEESHGIPCNGSFINEIENEVTAMLEGMKKSNFTPLKNGQCQNCPYGYLCNIEHRNEELI